MTKKQEDRTKEYESERRSRGESANVNWKEGNQPESRGVLFADVDGVSLMVYTDGLISIPAVRSYHPPKYATPMLATFRKGVVDKAKDKRRSKPNHSEIVEERTSESDRAFGPEM